jgi:acyl-CoA thioesterase-2
MAFTPRSLLTLLELEPSGEDRWLAPTPSEGPGRLFGGQVASQALRAAANTVEPGRPPHSLHGYFIRPGRPNEPLELVVERTRDGRSFTTRHVTAIQREQAVFELTASFHQEEPGLDWQPSWTHTGPGPEEIEMPGPSAGPMSALWHTNPFEIRPVTPIGPEFAIHPCWVRLREQLGEDSVAHACALTYVSDLAVVASARAPSNRSSLPNGASLDHSIWFHRPFHANEWLLFSVNPASNSGSRGLALGSFHNERGVLIASIAQEVLLRTPPATPTA